MEPPILRPGSSNCAYCPAWSRPAIACGTWASSLVVVTNQPDIARGKQTRDEVDRMHDVLRRRLPLDEIVVCAHDDADDCRCRKPRPGMILDAAARLDLDLAASVCVGDRWRDVEAGEARRRDGHLCRPRVRRAPSHGCRRRRGEPARRHRIHRVPTVFKGEVTI